MQEWYAQTMNLALIETFSAVMKTGSTTRAAALLGISQPAVSRALRRLEDTTRLRLFDRAGPRLIPTPEAALLHQELLRAEIGLDRLRQVVARMRDVGTGVLKVASAAATGLHFMPKVICAFLATRPNVALTFRVESSATVRELVASGQFDLGVCADEIDTSQLIAEPFTTFPGVCVMPEDHPLCARARIVPQDLEGLALVGLAPEDTARRTLQSCLDAAGVRCRQVIETPFSASVCQLVLEGAGVGLVNALTYVSGNFGALGLVARPFVPEIVFRSLIILPPQRAPSQIVRDFKSAMELHCAGLLPLATSSVNKPKTSSEHSPEGYQATASDC